MRSLGSIAASLCLVFALAACESGTGGTPAGAVDAVSDMAVGGGDADAAAGTDAAVGTDASSATDAVPGTDAAADSKGDADAAADGASGTDAAAGTDAAVGTDAGAGTDAAADVAPDSDAAGDVQPDISSPPVPTGGCSAEVTCDKMPGAYCLAPGAFGGCGMCMKVEGPGCKSDAECTATPNGICEIQYDNCLCEKIPQCYEGCKSDGDCDEGLSCASDHHCKVKTCASNSDCPSQFACAAGSCARKSCTASAQCTGAYCVNGSCYSKAGTCDLPKP